MKQKGRTYRLLMIGCCFLAWSILFAQQHPYVGMSVAGVKAIRAGETPPVFQQSLASTTIRVQQAMQEEQLVPVPKDLGGGFTHEQHKQNYQLMYQAATLYQLTGEEAYAEWVKEMLVAYHALFQKIDRHPSDRSYSPGKFFWQCLNDANWMVYTSQTYDCVFEYLKPELREQLEQELFRPYADFLSLENPKFFNRIHNHSTWANAAVGMMGMAMQDEELIQRALYGLSLKDIDLSQKDNDGGFIFESGKGKAGFFAQLDHAFSPDGYYTEGPYYQRYAMTPFLLFARALNQYDPSHQIFAYRDSLLIKAVHALVQQTDAEGQFFPINDAQKGMSIQANSVISAVDIAFGIQPDPILLAIARLQGQVLLDQDGFAIAQAVESEAAHSYLRPSVSLRDGEDGSAGALVVLRGGTSPREMALVFKCTAQGLGHGHYDKLSYSLYEGANEVLQDYGAARWVNVDQQVGGRYLPENKSWAKQSIAHNTLILNETSHFEGKYAQAEPHHSDWLFTGEVQAGVQVSIGEDAHAYPGASLRRMLVMWEDSLFVRPLVLDLFQWKGATEVGQIDLPFHFREHLLSTSYELSATSAPSILGKAHGYQYLLKEAKGTLEEGWAQSTWLSDRIFYTLSQLSEAGDSMLVVRLGANDPEFHLRREAALLWRRSQQADGYFFSILESHGTYDPVSEIPTQPYSQISSIETILENETYLLIRIQTKSGASSMCCIARQVHDPEAQHLITVGGTQRMQSRLAFQARATPSMPRVGGSSKTTRVPAAACSPVTR
ncbi:MAG: alginate lyase family protein, partial [Bacteroidota bacterium]